MKSVNKQKNISPFEGLGAQPTTSALTVMLLCLPASGAGELRSPGSKD